MNLSRGQTLYEVKLPNVSVLWLLVGSDVVHSGSGDDTNIDVTARAEVAHDACVNGSPHQILRRLQLREEHVEAYKMQGEERRLISFKILLSKNSKARTLVQCFYLAIDEERMTGGSCTSMPGLNPSSRIPRAARSPDPAQSKFRVRWNRLDEVREYMT